MKWVPLLILGACTVYIYIQEHCTTFELIFYEVQELKQWKFSVADISSSELLSKSVAETFYCGAGATVQQLFPILCVWCSWI